MQLSAEKKGFLFLSSFLFFCSGQTSLKRSDTNGKTQLLRSKMVFGENDWSSSIRSFKRTSISNRKAEQSRPEFLSLDGGYMRTFDNDKTKEKDKICSVNEVFATGSALIKKARVRLFIQRPFSTTFHSVD